MLLTETINKCVAAIEKNRGLRDSKRSAEDYLKTLSNLEQVRKPLKHTLDCATEMKKRGVVGKAVITQAEKDELLELADRCGHDVYERSLSSDLVMEFKMKEVAVTERVREAWKQAAANYADGVKGYLSMISGLTEDPLRARELVESITKAENSGATDVAVRRLVDEVEKAKMITDSFSINPDIEQFLRKVSMHQATVADLSPDVLAWLNEKKLLGRLKLRF